MSVMFFVAVRALMKISDLILTVFDHSSIAGATKRCSLRLLAYVV
jgi:hypothetical protein